MRRMVMVVALGVWLASCTIPPAQYSVPTPRLNTFMVMIERDYDTVWSALVDHLSQSSFGIDSFEKSSGLIVVSFSGSPDTFVDCGNWSREGSPAPYIQRLLLQRGPVSLQGKMNISVYKMKEAITRVRVNARYILTADWTIDEELFSSNTWTFDTGSSDSALVQEEMFRKYPRTCRPSYELESSILKAVQEISALSS